MDFGANLKQRIADKGIFLEGLAKMIKIHPYHLLRYECEQEAPFIDFVAKVA